MTSKKFFFILLSIIIGSIASIVGMNLWIDVFGIFGETSGKRINIYSNERFEKYLLSLNYVPSNFDALLFGPSTSVNIDIKNFSTYNFYNMSINGGNISEIKVFLENYLKKRKPDLVVLGMYPYLIISHGMKTLYLSKRSYWSAFGSIILAKHYLIKFFSQIKQKTPLMSAYGHQSFGFSCNAVKEKSSLLVEETREKAFRADLLALLDLKEFLQVLEEHGIPLLVYHHPVPRELYHHNIKLYTSYKMIINAMMPSGTVVVDFNDNRFSYINSNYDNFKDHAHLNDKGAQLVAHELDVVISSLSKK